MGKVRVNTLKNHFKNLAFKHNQSTLIQTLCKSKKQTNPIKQNFKKTDESVNKKPSAEGVKINTITYQSKSDLFTLLYSSIVFQWIESDRVT